MKEKAEGEGSVMVEGGSMGVCGGGGVGCIRCT